MSSSFKAEWDSVWHHVCVWRSELLVQHLHPSAGVSISIFGRMRRTLSIECMGSRNSRVIVSTPETLWRQCLTDLDDTGIIDFDARCATPFGFGQLARIDSELLLPPKWRHFIDDLRKEESSWTKFRHVVIKLDPAVARSSNPLKRLVSYISGQSADPPLHPTFSFPLVNYAAHCDEVGAVRY